MLARVGDLVGDRAVLDHALVALRVQAEPAVFETEVDDRAGQDDRHRQDREAPGRNVVLERDHALPAP